MSYPKLNILVAYPYADKGTVGFIKKNEKDIRFLLDSGAFTAWKARPYEPCIYHRDS